MIIFAFTYLVIYFMDKRRTDSKRLNVIISGWSQVIFTLKKKKKEFKLFLKIIYLWIATHRLGSCDSQALEHEGFSSWGAWT